MIKNQRKGKNRDNVISGRDSKDKDKDKDKERESK